MTVSFHTYDSSLFLSVETGRHTSHEQPEALHTKNNYLHTRQTEDCGQKPDLPAILHLHLLKAFMEKIIDSAKSWNQEIQGYNCFDCDHSVFWAQAETLHESDPFMASASVFETLSCRCWQQVLWHCHGMTGDGQCLVSESRN